MNSWIARAMGGTVVAAWTCLALVTARAAEPTIVHSSWAYTFAYALGAVDGVSRACNSKVTLRASAEAWSSVQGFFDDSLALSEASTEANGPSILSARQLALALEVYDEISDYLAAQPCSESNLLAMMGPLTTVETALDAADKIGKGLVRKVKVADLRGEYIDRHALFFESISEIKFTLDHAATTIIIKTNSINLTGK